MRELWQVDASRRVAILFCLVVLMVSEPSTRAQNTTNEREFPQSKAVVGKIVGQLQSSASGKLPVLDGFARTGDRALDHYSRGYYQCSATVKSAPSGGSRVQVSAKITAWYADEVGGESGYQVLPSNGRLESDFLDRVVEALAGSIATAGATAGALPRKSSPALLAPTISAPEPGDGESGGRAPGSSLSFKTGIISSEHPASPATQKAIVDKHEEELTAQAKSLAEILRNTAHPANLVAVKKQGTPILTSPNEGAKVVFLADAEDEFEILDKNVNWVHVRISRLSRGWIRRSSLELPEADTPIAASSDAPQPAGVPTFQVRDEQTSTFPGAWEPLRGKTVRILTVQKTGGPSSNANAKMDFAKALFEKEYAELVKAPSTTAGVVLIFDSEDGGMVAAPLLTLQAWKDGTLSDQAFWRRCFFDPPKMFTPSTTGSQ